MHRERLVRLTLAVVLVSWPGLAWAQTSSAASTARQTDAQLGFLTNYRFHLNAFGVVSSEEDFVWDTDFGGDIDIFDLEYFRGNLLVNYEGIIGEQIRAIDPNQGNYVITLSAWWRSIIENAEVGAVFHHVSRHLSDRDKEFAIAWNMLGLQYTSVMAYRGWDFDFSYRAMATVRRSFVDYLGEFGGSATAYRQVHPRMSLLLGGEVTLVPVDAADFGRERQVGSRFEIGARFPGLAGAGEVFLARERRIDQDSFDLQPTTFTMLGFRFLSH